MPTHSSYDYAIIRVAPRVERAEFINAGALLFCRTRRYLGAEIALDVERLLALAPTCDPDEIEQHLAVIPLLCRGGADAGPIGALGLAERFHWLTAPRSTTIQTSPIHSGICSDPETALCCLMAKMVHVQR